MSTTRGEIACLEKSLDLRNAPADLELASLLSVADGTSRIVTLPVSGLDALREVGYALLCIFTILRKRGYYDAYCILLTTTGPYHARASRAEMHDAALRSFVWAKPAHFTGGEERRAPVAVNGTLANCLASLATGVAPEENVTPRVARGFLGGVPAVRTAHLHNDRWYAVVSRRGAAAVAIYDTDLDPDESVDLWDTPRVGIIEELLRSHRDASTAHTAVLDLVQRASASVARSARHCDDLSGDMTIFVVDSTPPPDWSLVPVRGRHAVPLQTGSFETIHGKRIPVSSGIVAGAFAFTGRTQTERHSSGTLTTVHLKAVERKRGMVRSFETTRHAERR